MAAAARDRGGPRVDALYSLMQSFENKLGGGEGVEGLYGSITQNGMQKVLECLRHNTGLDQRSVFVDIGAGLGRPMLHAFVAAGVTNAWGIELDRVKCDKATAFCEHVMENLVTKELVAPNVPVPRVHCSPIEKVATLDPATHAYSFWEGVPTEGKLAFGDLFAASRTLRAVAVVQRAMRGEDPATVMRELGFGPVMLIASFPVKMSGSGRSFTAYVFSKLAPGSAKLYANAKAVPAPAALPLPAAEAQTAPQEQPAAGQRCAEEAPRAGATSRAAAEAAAAPAQPEGLRKGRPARAASASAAQQPESPSRARKQDADPAPSTPPKKACTSSPSAATQPQQPAAGDATTAVGASGCRASGRARALARKLAAGAAEGAEAEAGSGTQASQATQARPLAARQVLLTELPEYSRRTKQGVRVGKQAAGKAPAAAKADSSTATTVTGTRSSQRLANKARVGVVVEGH